MQSEYLSVIDKCLNELSRSSCCLHILILFDFGFVDHFLHGLNLLFFPP